MKLKILMILVAVLFVAGVVGSVLVLHMPKKTAVQIKSEGKVLYTLDLLSEADRTFTVKTAHGSNVIEIKEHKIRVQSADCPDQTCVKMGWLDSAAMPIVCLPHGLVLELTDGDSNGVDAVSE